MRQPSSPSTSDTSGVARASTGGSWAGGWMRTGLSRLVRNFSTGCSACSVDCGGWRNRSSTAAQPPLAAGAAAHLPGQHHEHGLALGDEGPGQLLVLVQLGARAALAVEGQQIEVLVLQGVLQLVGDDLVVLLGAVGGGAPVPQHP